MTKRGKGAHAKKTARTRGGFLEHIIIAKLPTRQSQPNTVLGVKNVAWYTLRSEADGGCFRVEFQFVVDCSDTGTEPLVHKVTILNVFSATDIS